MAKGKELLNSYPQSGGNLWITVDNFGRSVGAPAVPVGLPSDGLGFPLVTHRTESKDLPQQPVLSPVFHTVGV